VNYPQNFTGCVFYRVSVLKEIYFVPDMNLTIKYLKHKKRNFCLKNYCLFSTFEVEYLHFNPLTPNDLQRRRVVSPLNIKIPSKNMREKPTNTPFIHSVD
jgi:hypothetical protein